MGFSFRHIAQSRVAYPPRKPPTGFFCGCVEPRLGVASFLTVRLVESKRVCAYCGRLRAAVKRGRTADLDAMEDEMIVGLNDASDAIVPRLLIGYFPPRVMTRDVHSTSFKLSYDLYSTSLEQICFNLVQAQGVSCIITRIWVLNFAVGRFLFQLDII
jgi:hypothetical protein